MTVAAASRPATLEPERARRREPPRTLARCECGGACGGTCEHCRRRAKEHGDGELQRLLSRFRLDASDRPTPEAVLALQRTAGNRAATSALAAWRLQREEKKPKPQLPKGWCKPFANEVGAKIEWTRLSAVVPRGSATATGCSEVKPVWDAYFAATSQPFAFSDPGSCVVQAAKTDPWGGPAATQGATKVLELISKRLPVTLSGVTSSGIILRVPLSDAVGPGHDAELHPNIVYNYAFNAAANLAGGVGKDGQGSDIFGDDDRELQGTVEIEVKSFHPSGQVSGEVRWVPHVHAKDTVDFCPGNPGAMWQQSLTVPMSMLEASGKTRDVPITIDYDLERLQSEFTIMLDRPKPVDRFPRTGPAATTGSLIRIRTGPGKRFPTVGLLGERGTRIEVETQVRGEPVDGNDVWNKIDRGYVSDRYVGFEADTPVGEKGPQESAERSRCLAGGACRED